MTFLQVALNGDRDHPAAPKTAEAIARDAAAVVAAGAHSVHVHAYDAKGHETFDAAACSAALRAIRSAVPGVPISMTTSSTILADPADRLQAVRSWSDLPDLVTVNQGEDGITALGDYLLSRGVAIEAGLLSAEDAARFVVWPLRDRCHRIMIEPVSPDPDAAVEQAARMEATLAESDVTLPQVHHGIDGGCWAVNRRALARGHGIRTGLEDVATMPDGSPAEGNTALVVAAQKIIAQASRQN